MSIQTNTFPGNPQIEVIKSGKTGLFTNYIYKAIPLAFDESMSYYETLCGLLHYLKNVILPTVNNNADAVAELQTLYEELRSYVDDYFKDLDVQEEINNKLDAMVESGQLQEIIASYLNSKAIFAFDNVEDMKNATNLINGSYARTLGYYEKNDGGGALYRITDTQPSGFYEEVNNNLYATLNQTEINPKMFGATDSSNVDQSDYVKTAINYCFNNNIEKINLNGEYFINQTMKFENCNNLIIENGTFYVHEDDTLLATNFNILQFVSCKNIIINNIRCIEVNTDITRTRKLYVGGIYFNSSSNCKILNSYFENLDSSIILYRANSKCVIENNYIITNIHSPQFSESAILNFASRETTIKNNKIIGEYYDGTLSIYGAGCVSVVVDSNTIQNKYDENFIYLSEGITIDAGCVNTIITNNIISDMYYGIDNKNDCRDTLISNNILYGNKISIADRPGEENKLTYNCMITNNDIRIQKDWNTNEYGTALFNGFYYIGIFISNKSNANIKSNKIHCYGNLEGNTMCGVTCYLTTANNQYMNPVNIIANEILLSTGFGNTTSNAGTGSGGIVIKDVKKGIISENSFKTDTTGNTYFMIKLVGSNDNVLITNNLCHNTSAANHSFILVDEQSTNTNFKIINNQIRLSKPIPNLMDITNVVEDERTAIPAHKIKGVNLSANTWTTVFKIKLQYSGIVHFNLTSILASSGNKFIYGEYVLAINNTSITEVSKTEQTNGLDVQFINEGTNQEISVQIKSSSNVNSYGSLLLHNLMATQNITLLNS